MWRWEEGSFKTKSKQWKLWARYFTRRPLQYVLWWRLPLGWVPLFNLFKVCLFIILCIILAAICLKTCYLNLGNANGYSNGRMRHPRRERREQRGDVSCHLSSWSLQICNHSHAVLNQQGGTLRQFTLGDVFSSSMYFGGCFGFSC